MLVICVKTGLTYARKVHREGEIFIITGRLEREYKNLSEEAWKRKQRRTYSGDITFRQPTSEEIVAAIRDKKLDPGSAAIRGQLSKNQLRIALDYAASKEAKKLKAIEMLREGLDMEIEDAPEEKVVKAPEKEVVKAPEKEAEAPAEELELVEAPKKEAEAPEEEPKPEEPEKEPEASEEAPEKEPEAPPEEPVKEPAKKDKKKDK